MNYKKVVLIRVVKICFSSNHIKHAESIEVGQELYRAEQMSTLCTLLVWMRKTQEGFCTLHHPAIYVVNGLVQILYRALTDTKFLLALSKLKARLVHFIQGRRNFVILRYTADAKPTNIQW